MDGESSSTISPINSPVQIVVSSYRVTREGVGEDQRFKLDEPHLQSNRFLSTKPSTEGTKVFAVAIPAVIQILDAGGGTKRESFGQSGRHIKRLADIVPDRTVQLTIGDPVDDNAGATSEGTWYLGLGIRVRGRVRVGLWN
ncbi:MAG: hypothetical protein JWP44_4418 [Mucilaginibacter sp.]|nr:hypothetical protein [Mucilaginibacter sp.]